MHNGVSKVLIDHVVVTVGDQLEATADRYQRLGFSLTERGHHTLGTSNHLAIFETDYLELLGFLLAVKRAGRICGAIHRA